MSLRIPIKDKRLLWTIRIGGILVFIFLGISFFDAQKNNGRFCDKIMHFLPGACKASWDNHFCFCNNETFELTPELIKKYYDGIALQNSFFNVREFPRPLNESFSFNLTASL